MSVSIFDSAEMTKAVNNLDNAQRTGRILQQFPDGDVHMAAYMEYGYDSDNPRILQVRKIFEGSSPVAHGIGSLKRINFPKYRPSSFWEEQDARPLDPAVMAYTGTNTDANSNLEDRIAKQLDKLRRRIQTSHIYNCYKALSTGAITFQYEDGTTATIDYGYTSGTATTSTILTAKTSTARWEDAGSFPLDDLETMASNIRATTEYTGEFDVLMGKTAFKAFRTHASVTGNLDNRRVDLGGLTLRNGSEWKGSIDGFDIYQVSFSFVANTTWTEVFDTDTVVMVPRENLDWFSTEYGAIWEVPQGSTSPAFIPTKYFSKSVIEEDPVTQKIIVESRPIPVIKNPLAVRVWNVTT